MKQYLYKLPDILIIHIKRFNMNAKHKEKIRNKINFPLHELNMSKYKILDLNSNVQDSDYCDVYDLYGVSNHIGGMNGGHYTAYIKHTYHNNEVKFGFIYSK